jgi:Tfp pilus assembly PilM family ATPase
VERAIFAGGYANESVLLNVLRRQLAVEIEIAQPLRGFDMPQNAVINFDGYEQSPLCEWAVAVGLGLKGWNKFR